MLRVPTIVMLLLSVSALDHDALHSAQLLRKQRKGHQNGQLARETFDFAAHVQGTGEVNVENSEQEDESDLEMASRLGRSDPNCKDKLDKASALLHFQSQMQVGGGLSTDQLQSVHVVSQALGRLREGNATMLSLELVMAGLGNMTLRTALQMGDVWTASDQSDFFFFCLPGLTPSRALEEGASLADIGLDTFTAVHHSRSINKSVHSQAAPPMQSFYYCFRIGTSKQVMRAFVHARKVLEEQVPCLDFQAVQPDMSGKGCAVSPAIEVRDENTGCWTAYDKDTSSGRTTGALLNLGRGCELKGMILHQLLKILGMRNEALRIDRDKYLNVRFDKLRKEVSARVLEKISRRISIPASAYTDDPFDLLSLSMHPSKAFTDGINDSILPRRSPFLAHILGQRMGLSELDVAELANRFGCDDAVSENPTLDLTQKLLRGDGLKDKCEDRQNTTDPVTPRKIDSAVNCKHVKSVDCRGRLQMLCPASCLLCMPISNRTAALNESIPQTPAAYCDDAGCETPDPEGAECKEANKDAQQLPCFDVSRTTVLPFTNRQNGDHVPDCVDSDNSTGIKFRDGSKKATCDDLRNYCGHKTLGANVRRACLATCHNQGFECPNASTGRANATTIVNTTNTTKAQGCSDLGKNETPVFMFHGVNQSCDEIKNYCFGHPKSESITRKCPVSCGACVPGHDKVGYNDDDDDDADDFRSDDRTTTTHSPDDFKNSTQMPDEDATAIGCDRRRRWGFCSTRRRQA